MERIQQKGRGWVFIPSDFFDIGEHSTVRAVLSRLNAKGKIRHFSHPRGFYDFPRYSQLWNEFGVPDQDGIVEAIARKEECAILPSGATAANQLGLSEQVPAKLEYVWSKKQKPFKLVTALLFFIMLLKAG